MFYILYIDHRIVMKLLKHVHCGLDSEMSQFDIYIRNWLKEGLILKCNNLIFTLETVIKRGNVLIDDIIDHHIFTIFFKLIYILVVQFPILFYEHVEGDEINICYHISLLVHLIQRNVIYCCNFISIIIVVYYHLLFGNYWVKS